MSLVLGFGGMATQNKNTLVEKLGGVGMALLAVMKSAGHLFVGIFSAPPAPTHDMFAAIALHDATITTDDNQRNASAALTTQATA